MLVLGVKGPELFLDIISIIIENIAIISIFKYYLIFYKSNKIQSLREIFIFTFFLRNHQLFSINFVTQVLIYCKLIIK